MVNNEKSPRASELSWIKIYIAFIKQTMASEKPRKYVLGGSTTELDRIHGIHDSTVQYMGKLLLAPVEFESPKSLRILDSGTAAGE